MVLQILRGVFIVLAAAVTILYVLPFQEEKGVDFGQVVLMILLTIAVAAVIIAGDVMSPRKRLSAVSGVFLGLIAGMLAAYALGFVVDLIGLITAPRIEISPPDISEAQILQLDEITRKTVRDQIAAYQAVVDDRNSYLRLLEGVKVIIGLITCYLSISLVLQTKDDFRFVIPYVEFAKQIRGPRPTILDTSIIIDGRILEILDTSVMQGTLVIPKFVINELQQVADSSDKLRRARGRRGLDLLKQLQSKTQVDVVIDDTPAEGENVDQKLQWLCEERRARLMTTDFNLTKIARLRGLDVTNLNDLAQALKPVVLPGESMQIKLVKSGESPGQAVGYLEDGTMVVVEHGRPQIGHEVNISVTSTYQTAAGRMIFGKYEGPSEPGGATSDTSSQEEDTDATDQYASSDEPTSNPQPPSAASSSEDTGRGRASRPPHARNPRRG